MNLFLVGVHFALLSSQDFWTCIFLILWLCRHRKLKISYRRKAKTRPSDTPLSTSAHPRAKPDWVREKVLYLASHLHSCREIAHAFNRWQGCWDTVGHTWVWEFLRDNAGEIKRVRRERKRRKPYFVPVAHTWALDLTFMRSPHGVTFTILGIIDAGSRKLLYRKVVPAKCAFALVGHLLLAFSEHGLPFAIRTDNEAMFTSAFWRVTLKVLGVLHRRGPPRQAWHNGRIERLFGTLKPPLENIRATTPAALQEALDEFQSFYNRIRPHQSLGGLTPEEAWQGKTMTDVQETHAQAEGQWVEGFGGRLVGYQVRTG